MFGFRETLSLKVRIDRDNRCAELRLLLVAAQSLGKGAKHDECQ